MHTAGNETCTACPANSTTTSKAATRVDACMCTAGYMDSSAYPICSSAKPCRSGFFCTSEYGGGEGVCFSCVDVGGCCSARNPLFNWGTGDLWVQNALLSKENVQKCHAACSGFGVVEPGLPGSSCAAVNWAGSGGGSGSGSGSSYNYYDPSYGSGGGSGSGSAYSSYSYSPSRQGSQIVHLVSSHYNPHTTHTTYG